MVFPWLAAAVVGGSIISAVSQPKRPKLPEAPKPEDELDVIDKISGTQSVIVRGPNGKYRKVVSHLPKTKEEERQAKFLTKIISESMANLNELYAANPESMSQYTSIINSLSEMGEERAKNLAKTIGGDIPTQENFEKQVQDFKNLRNSMLDDHWRKEENRMMEGLVQNGHLDSSAANEMRAQLSKNKAMSRMESDFMADEYGNKLANDRLNRDMGLHNAERTQKLQDYGLQETALINKTNIEKEKLGLLEQQENREIEKQKHRLGMADASVKKDLEKAQKSFAPALGAQSFQHQLQSHQANVAVQQQNFANRMANPSFGQTIGKLAVGIGAMGMGDYFKNYDWGGTSQSTPSTPSTPVQAPQFDFKMPQYKYKP